MLSFSDSRFLNNPYPIGLATHVFGPNARCDAYVNLVRTWPDESLFAKMGTGYHKLSLSERNNALQYHRFIQDTESWREFYRYIKSPNFLGDICACLSRHGLDVLQAGQPYRTRFEFSSMPANGGFIAPHTDIPSKVVTLILPIFNSSEWEPVWGGSTDVLVPKSGVNARDYQTPLEDFDVYARFPYAPNQAVIFIKNDVSWHSVGPIQGPDGHWRRTVTVNIEKVGK